MSALKKVKTMPKVKAKAKAKGFVPYYEMEGNIFYTLKELLEALKEQLSESNYIPEILYYSSRSNAMRLDASLEDLPYCCGVTELGEIRIDSNFPEECIKGFVKTLFDEFAGCLIINTVSDSYCKPLQDVLDVSPYFTCVKIFDNPNTSRTIKMFVSNNK